jgi:hypothetical protein
MAEEAPSRRPPVAAQAEAPWLEGSFMADARRALQAPQPQR